MPHQSPRTGVDVLTSQLEGTFWRSGNFFGGPVLRNFEASKTYSLAQKHSVITYSSNTLISGCQITYTHSTAQKLNDSFGFLATSPFHCR